MTSAAPRGSRRAAFARAAGALAALSAGLALATLPPAAFAADPANPHEKAPEPAPTAPASVATTDRFDGDWTIRIDCPADPDPSGARAYTVDFPASVLNGNLFGSRGPQGAVGSLQVEGTIAPDGSAALQARGRTGNPDLATDKPAVGTPYSYDVHARFDGATGTGKRQEQRACDFGFTRR